MARRYKTAQTQEPEVTAANGVPLFITGTPGVDAVEGPEGQGVGEGAAADGDHDSETGRIPDAPSLPTTDDILLELWKIATGEGTESSRVSALRTLADIMGLLKPRDQDPLPEAMTWLLDALSRGMGEGSSV